MGVERLRRRRRPASATPFRGQGACSYPERATRAFDISSRSAIAPSSARTR